MHEVEEPTLQPAAASPSHGGVGRSTTAQILAQQAAIAQIGQSALSDQSLDTLLNEACVLVSRVLETELVDVLELAPDGRSLRIVAGVGWRRGIVGEVSVGASNDSQSGYTIATGGPVIVADMANETRFKVSPLLTEHGAVSGMSVRIGDTERPFGVLAAFTARRGRFTRDDAHFLQAVANVIGAAAARLRIESELRASRDELSAIVAAIDEGITVHAPDGRLIYANATAARLSGYLDGKSLLTASLDELDAHFELADADGHPIGFGDLPGQRALAGETPEPMLVRFRIRATGEERWALISGAPVRDEAGRVVRVINTFRDVTDERWARDVRQFQTDAVAVLSSTLDTTEAARRLANLCVPRLADWCTVHLAEPDGAISAVAIAHANPDRVKLAREAQRFQAISPDEPTGVAYVIREGASELREITDELLAMTATSDEHLDVLRRLELRSYVSVPLVARGGPIGALTLVMAESGRSLGERELALTQELGARAGIALENARLYQAANERRAELDAVLGALAEAVLVFDASGRLRLGNQAAKRIFAGRLPSSLDDVWARLGDDAGPAASAATEGAAVEAHVDGRWLEVRRYRTSHVGSADLAPTVVVLRDVTDARAARAARDAFMGVLSHELRTPITTIYGGSELLERGLDAVHRAEVIADIRVESERLARLVEDLLVMSRVERGMVETADEPILLQHLLTTVIHATAPRWSRADIDVRVAERLPAVRGDATYIEQVMRNLLSNAVRYGRGAEDGITVMADEIEGHIVVRVLDNGPGFGGEDPERLFDLFFRTSAARSVPGGAGIGLFVCRNLIETMGGRIWARERPQGGAEFGFSLPVMEFDAG